MHMDREPEWPRSTWIGRTDGKSICLPSESAALEVLSVIEKYDPEGIKRGDYFIDVDNGEGDLSDNTYRRILAK